MVGEIVKMDLPHWWVILIDVFIISFVLVIWLKIYKGDKK